MELQCQVQNYEWGKVGSKSIVANLLAEADPGFRIEEHTPYAELWMGTHPSGPSKLRSIDESLADVIEKYPEYIGDIVTDYFGNQIPFLFKILSVNKALSIQAHPAKKHAEILHKQRPDLYKDSNHKPELAIALTPFEALCGFRPYSEIKNFLQQVPEFHSVVGAIADDFLLSDEASLPNILQKCFRALMTCPESNITEQLNKLLLRFTKSDQHVRSTQLASLIERLSTEFPNDVGCFSVYFFNVLTLSPGEALYLGPNEPHAYLSGDCVECMACSDNVVRAGLTPKFKDVETLCSMLDYTGESADTKRFQPLSEDDFCCIFKPPVPDFAVAKIHTPQFAGASNCYTLIKRFSASILVVVSGYCLLKPIHNKKQCVDRSKLTPGCVMFLPAGDVLELAEMSGDFLLFQAFANIELQ